MQKSAGESKWTLCLVVILNAVIWMWSIGVIVGVAYATYLLLEDLVKPGAHNEFIKTMSLSAYVTIVMLVVPTIFKWVGNLAGGATRLRMYQTLLQTVLLAITLTSVIIFRYYENKVCM